MADVLIVEDSDMQSILIRKYLRGTHAVVGRAVSKDEAVQLSRDNSPDAVVMDLNLKQGDGLAATESITSIHDPPSIIISTVHVDDGLKERALNLGGDEYLTKPYEKQDLLDAIERALQSQQTSNGVETQTRTENDLRTLLSPPPQMSLADVGGMNELKQRLTDKIIEPLEERSLYEDYGLGVVNAVLLYGPPGTGKTYFSKALAGELGYNFIEARPDTLTSSFVGEAASNIGALFEIARENQPCLVFIDELEGIASERVGGAKKTQSERQMINQLLAELSDTKGEDVIFIGATNLPDEVDDAAWDRFDERIEVPPPDGDARAAILRIHLREPPTALDEIDWTQIKEQTTGYSARDLRSVAKEAARIALDESREQESTQPVSQPHLEQAISNSEPSLNEYADWD